MKRTIMTLAAGIACLLLVAPIMAGSTASHTVTVTVNAINEVAIAGGNVSLTINSATAGSNPNNATDSDTADLAWTTNEASKKITVETNLAEPTFTLKVQAANVSGGTAADQVTLSNVAANFVTAVATTTGGCDLSYTASSTAAQGTGTDTHTVTYTITAS